MGKAAITVNKGVRKRKTGKENNQRLRKYDWWNILPKFLFEQSRKVSNLYFLVVIVIEQVPDVANRGRYGTLSALLLMLTLFFFKEVFEHLKRRYADDMGAHFLYLSGQQEEGECVVSRRLGEPKVG